MASHAIPLPYAGAHDARRCLVAIARLEKRAANRGDDPDLAAVALILDPFLTAPPGFSLALGEFIAAALGGAVIDPKRWQPLCATAGRA